MAHIQGIQGMQYSRDGHPSEQQDYSFFNEQYATSTDKTDYPEFVGQLQTYDDLHIKAKQVGDTKKAVQRIFEVVEGTAAAELKPQWRRLPLGPDAGKRILGKLQLMKENVEAYEPIWSTTDMDEDKIEDFFKQREGK